MTTLNNKICKIVSSYQGTRNQVKLRMKDIRTKTVYTTTLDTSRWIYYILWYHKLFLDAFALYLKAALCCPLVQHKNV